MPLLRQAALAVAMSVLLLVVSCPHFSRSAYAQAAASLSALASLVPSDATDANIEMFQLDGSPYATVEFHSPSSSPTYWYRIYDWDGTQWFQSYDVYQLAHDDCQTGASLSGTAPGNPCDQGQLTLSSINATKLVKLPGDKTRFPDMLAVDIRYSGDFAFSGGGPLVFLRPNGQGFQVASTVTFGRYDLGSVSFSSCSGCGTSSDFILVSAPAALPSDPGCCPTGTQYIILDWAGSDLSVSARCTKAKAPSGFLDRDVCSS